MPNCCDDYGNCRQGRDCPVRVATARPLMKAADPLPPSVWQVYLRHLAKWMLLSILGLLWLGFIVACAASIDDQRLPAHRCVNCVRHADVGPAVKLSNDLVKPNR
jgi:hypothetical protein